MGIFAGKSSGIVRALEFVGSLVLVVPVSESPMEEFVFVHPVAINEIANKILRGEKSLRLFLLMRKGTCLGW